jgi:lysophospholipase L1-like esterase
MRITEHDIIVFDGDSITDCGRDRENVDSYGDGYVSKIVEVLKVQYPGIKIYNRGISGDTSRALVNRVEDTLSFKPTIVNVLIGINDTWRWAENITADMTTFEEFEANYRRYLTALRAGGVRDLIIMEPFVLPYPVDRRNWRVDLDPRIQIIRRLGKEFKATYIPLDGLLNGLFISVADTYLADDGVHPSDICHEIIKDLFLSYQ